jgi:hypothetical protein
MSFEYPLHSKNTVDKAGDLLRKSLTASVDAQELAKAQDILSNWRASHSYIINTFQATLRDKTKKLNVECTYCSTPQEDAINPQQATAAANDEAEHNARYRRHSSCR